MKKIICFLFVRKNRIVKMNKISHDPNEIIDVVDEFDNVIGSTTRKEVHTKGILHREVYVYLINSNKEVLLQKRKDNHLWDHSIGGHFPINQSYEVAALRESKEELGITLNNQDLKEVAKEKFIKIKTSHKGLNKRFAKIFLIKKDIPLTKFKIDKEEIEEIRYFNIDELKKLLLTPSKMTISSKKILEKYILKELK
ncbi:hypothetical protein CEE44_01970 [Candidatus Woesearchaeota archaeon B3_Woes]|nr:MAG: hypothetical protein CEE44_01970 [Candidatus Woesearchaeota archaeon B3_Woes]